MPDAKGENDVTEMGRLERVKEEFMQVVSHELRNPLQVIMGLVSLLRIDLKDPANQDEALRHLDLMKDQVAHVTALVEDVLMASRLSSGSLKLDLKRVDLVAILDQALSAYVDDPTHLWITCTRAPSPVWLMGDVRRLGQVVVNLLSNAGNHTPPGKRIWASVEVTAASALLKVEDEGIGIPSGQLEQVFSGFHRAGNVTNWRSGGIGLGLYISRNIARRHRGDLWAENRPGGGTIMCLRLPLDGQPA